MLAVSENIRSSGKAGSDQCAARTTRLTRNCVDQAGQKLRYAAISVELPEDAHADRSMSIREVPGWQVRPVGVMNLRSASWRSLDQMGRV